MSRAQALLPLTLGLTILAGCAGGPGHGTAVRRVDCPAAPGSGEPNLVAGADGRVYLSWIEPRETGGHELRFSSWHAGGWSVPKTIAAGEDWFVNWADFPSMAALEDGTLAAHWLVRSGESTYAYDVKLAVSRDGGDTWSDPVTPHDDGTRTEHGFVSIVPSTEGHFDVVWLDGRETVGGADGGGHGQGAMTLRSARLGRDGAVSAGRLIDDRVCDCCQTDAVRAAGGLALVYRDRTEGEVRDVAATRLEEAGWTAPVEVHRDGWVIAACPVNGPAVSAVGKTLACAWFTAAGSGTGRVLAGFSEDGGATFAEPIRIDAGQPQGRVDVGVLEDGTAVVAWLEQGRILLRRLGPEGPLGPPTVAAATSESRASGFPRMARLGRDLFLAWTEPGEPSRVRTATISP